MATGAPYQQAATAKANVMRPFRHLALKGLPADVKISFGWGENQNIVSYNDDNGHDCTP